MLYCKGIGKAAAVLLAKKGAKIAISDLDKDKAEDVVNEIRGFQGEAESFPGNALDEEFPPRLVDSVLRRWGKINCLINNAGMLSTQQKSVVANPFKDFATIVQSIRWARTSSISS